LLAAWSPGELLHRHRVRAERWRAQDEGAGDDRAAGWRYPWGRTTGVGRRRRSWPPAWSPGPRATC